MSFGLDLPALITAMGAVGALLIMGILYAESGLLVGFFLPGDTILFTAGFLASRNVFGFSVHLLILLFWLSAVAGDNTGYWIGHKLGPKIFRKQDSLVFHQDNLRRAERFYEKYGPVTILIARFVPLIRTFAPVVAGVGRMRYRRFVFFDAIGCLLWVTSITYIAYFAGNFLDAHGIKIDELILPVVALAMLITVGSPLVHILANRESRKLFLDKLLRRQKAAQKTSEQ